MFIDCSAYYMLLYLLLPGLWLLLIFFKKRMLGPGFRNQECKMVVRPALWVLVTGVVLPAVEQQ